MRIGAIFARGSCRALKWMLVLGALSVLGSAQAAAQAPTIEKAEYDSASSRIITVTTSVPVYLDEGTLQALAADFALSMGAIAADTPQGPLAVINLPNTSVPGSTTFDLRFASTIGTLRGAGADPLMLTYTSGAGRTILQSGTTADPMITTTEPITVTGPEDDTELTLEISMATKAAFADPLQVGTSFMAVELPVATGAGDVQPTYNVRGLPPGIIEVANNVEGEEDVAFNLGVDSGDGQTLATNGMLPDNIGTYPVVYTATAGVESAEDGFTITLANTPEAVTDLRVIAAGPSSLEVTWKEPNDNNADIISYDLDYKADGTSETDWLPALLPISIIASKSYTIEGLAPGAYDVRVRATNMLGDSIWAETGGRTGAGPGKPTLTVTVDSPMQEDRDGIPVTVKATVPPSALSQRTLTVTLSLSAAGTAEERAELPNSAGIPPDVNWAGATTLTFTFSSNLESEGMVYLNTEADDDAEDERFTISASSKEVPGVFEKAGAGATVMIDDDEVQEYKLELPVALENSKELKEGNGDDPVAMTLVVSPPRTLPKSFFVNLQSAQDASDYSLSSGGTSSGGPTAVSLRIDMDGGSGVP